MEARRQWANILKMLKEKNNQSKILYPAKLWSEREIKTFPDKQKLRKFNITRPTLQKKWSRESCRVNRNDTGQ